MQPRKIIDFFDEIGKPVLDIRQSPVFPEIDLFGRGIVKLTYWIFIFLK